MYKNTRIMLGNLFALVTFGFFVTSAFATSGTLVLTSNTRLSEDHYGNILISSSHVTLDCDGHTVFGPGVDGFSGGINVGPDLQDVTVRRCVVTAFSVNGIFSAAGTSRSRYEYNTAYANGNHGMHIDGNTESIIVGNTSRSNGAIGIVLTGGIRNWVIHNDTHDNKVWAGIALLTGCSSNVVLDNTSRRNAIGYVLDGATNNRLSSNLALSNDTHGYVLVRGASNNLLERNTSKKNLIGFELNTGSNANRLVDNSASRSTFEGFKIDQSNYNRLVRNTSQRNGGAGFLVVGGSSFNVLKRNLGADNGSLDAYEEGTGTGDEWIENIFGISSGF
jgi:parallel beta-helix repeat protein